jgi:octaprenyl-diphosphate synthase
MFDTASGSTFTSSTSEPTLESIRAVVAEELDQFQEFFREAMHSSSSSLVNHISHYMIRQKGKQIRPLLVLLSAKMCGTITRSAYHGATLVELLHTATLVHDDVVDEAERRRGAFSVNALWKNKVSVLFGDYLLSRGLLLALDNDEHRLLQVLSDAVRRMSEGELLQIQKSRRLDIDEETYFQIISDKTASLIAACTTAGAVSASDEPQIHDRMNRFGETLGLAFQIRDDLFDYGARDVGKPLGIDIQEKKMTLPLIVALRESSRLKRRRILRIVKKDDKTSDDIERVTSFVNAYGGIEYAENKMETLARKADELLDPLPSSESKTALQDLITFTVTRDK